MNKINIFSFFSGAGFLDLGFELTHKYDVVYVNEYHKPFNDIYRYARASMGIPEPEYGHHIESVIDLLVPRKLEILNNLISKSKAEHITGFIGGPPCPDFSVAGKNKGKDGENGMLSGTYVSLICETKPHFFLFENVKGLYRTSKHREFFESLKQKLSDAGYVMTEQLVNAIEYGAPQNRERIILIGFHLTLLRQLHITPKCVENAFPWEKFKSFSRAILDTNWPTQNEFESDKSTSMPVDVVKELTVQYWWDKNDVMNHPNAKMYFQPKAGLAKFLTIKEGDDSKKCYKRLHRWRYSPTAAYGNNEVHVHPYKARRISVSEALAIQSLPKEFILPTDITLTDAFKTIGNGVPYLLAKGVASTIYDFIKTYCDESE